MKKIGILHGKERTFPEAFVARVNALAEPGITAEPVSINKVIQGDPTEYAVILAGRAVLPRLPQERRA